MIVVWDLDDTLYSEREFVLAGYKNVADYLEQHQYIDTSEILYGRLVELLDSGNTDNIFVKALSSLGAVVPDSMVRDQLVPRYREGTSKLSLYPGISAVLMWLRSSGCPQHLVTDGPVASQEKKISALGLADVFDTICLTQQKGFDSMKPSIRAYSAAIGSGIGHAGKVVCIGDNSSKDFVTPNRLGWVTVKFLVPGQLHSDRVGGTREFAPQHVVRGVAELRLVLEGVLS